MELLPFLVVCLCKFLQTELNVNVNVCAGLADIIQYKQCLTCPCWSTGPHLQFEDEVSALRLQVKKLQTLGVNKIIALGHSGFKVDKEIAKKVSGVDVVIGGHSNTFLFTGMELDSGQIVVTC